MITNQRKMDAKINESDEMLQLMKKVKAYEYKLDKMKQKHNQALAEIKRLHENVNLVRRERVIFDNVFEKLEQDLKNKEEILKKYLLDHIKIENERSNILEDLKSVQTNAHDQKETFLRCIIFSKIYMKFKLKTKILTTFIN